MEGSETDLGVPKGTVQEEGMHIVCAGSKEIEQRCPSDLECCGCIQHTSLGSLYSDCGYQSGREDVKENASAHEDGKDLGMVSCHVGGTNRGSLHSNCSKQSGREDVKESASALEDCKDLGMLSCHVKDGNREDKLQVDRCRRTDGKRWRCRKKIQPGSIYCEHHHIMRRGGYKAKGVDASKAGEKLPLIRSSEALCALKEEEGLCLAPLKLADGILQVATARSVATSGMLSAKEELINAQCETKPLLCTLEYHNVKDAWRSKTEENRSEPGQSVMAMAAMQKVRKEIPPASLIFEEVRHEGKEETKQHLHRLGVEEHEEFESSKKEAKSTGLRQSVTAKRAMEEGWQQAKPDLNALEEEELDEEGEKGEHHRTRGAKAGVKQLEMVLRTDEDSQQQASTIQFKALTNTDVEREGEEVSAKALRLATGPFGGSIAQVVVSASYILAEEEKVHKGMGLFPPGLEQNIVEEVQRSERKPMLIGHGQSNSLVKHNEQEEAKPEQHILQRIMYGVKQETAPKIPLIVETHSLENVCRSNEMSGLAGHQQMIGPEKSEHRGERMVEVGSPVEGLDHPQISRGDAMPRFYESSGMLVSKKESSFSLSENGSKMHKGKGFLIERSNLAALSEISSQNPKRKLVEQDDPSLSKQALILDGSLHVTKKSPSPMVSNSLPGQCHGNNDEGRGCSRQCQPGCMYCEHHEGQLLGTSGKKKMILQLELDKHILATCLKGCPETQILRVAIDVSETLAKGLKTETFNRTGGPPDKTTAVKDSDALPLGRCHRKDGKGWQCAQQCKHGSIYCDRHQRQRSKGRILHVHSQQQPAFSGGPDVQSVEYSSSIYTGNKQLTLSAVPTSNSGSEHGLKPQSRNQELETRIRKQDDMGLALLSLRTPMGMPASVFQGSCLWKAKTSEQMGKADNAPNKCHRKDGKKWQCSRLCMPGYNHCEHHQGRGRKMKVIKT